MIARFFPVEIRGAKRRGGEVVAAEEEEGTRVRSSIYHPPERIEVNHLERLERREEFKFYQGARKTRKINYHS